MTDSTLLSLVFITFIIVVVSFLMTFIIAIFLISLYLKNQAQHRKKKKLEDETYEKKLSKFSESMANALGRLSYEKIGALIVIEKKDDISLFKKNGYEISGRFSPEFTISIFSNKKSALHDGAMLISEFGIIAISSYLPMTKNTIDVKYGARHRAAIGMSELNDSITFIVSETTGNISYAFKGKIHNLSWKHEELIIQITRILDIR